MPDILPAQQTENKTTLGFWLYLMTDCILFASLFATYAVLHNNTAGGPSSQELFDLPFVLTETLLLLASSFTCGLALLAGYMGHKKRVLFWLVTTFILGAGFLAMELNEFSHFISEGAGFDRSGFLSAFFTLVGTHGLHITVGLGWIIALGIQIAKQGITTVTSQRLLLFSLFWHFLDIVWIFIFTIVYLMGVI